MRRNAVGPVPQLVTGPPRLWVREEAGLPGGSNRLLGLGSVTRRGTQAQVQDGCPGCTLSGAEGTC